MEPIQGMLTLAPNVNQLPAAIKRDSTNTLIPGMAVKLVDVTDQEIIVEKAAATDAIYGFITYSTIKNSYTSSGLNRRMDVAFRDCVMYMTAGAAIARGASLEIAVTGTASAPVCKVITNAGTNQVVAIALDKAAADGDLIRVQILTPLVNQKISLASLPAIAFTDLSDVPSAYTGAGLEVVRVNVGETALEFHAMAFLDLSDTPSSYTGAGSDTVKVNAGATALEFAAVSDNFSTQLFHVRDEKSNGVAGGNFTNGAWQTRTLNTSMTNEISGASLSSNQITLPSGTYFIRCICRYIFKCKFFNSMRFKIFCRRYYNAY